jgi:hypothetical protein
MSNHFSITLVTRRLGDELEDRILNELGDIDVSVGVQAGLTTVDAIVPSSSAIAAAQSLTGRLEPLGVNVVRLLPDLVTQAQIARTAKVSRATVSLWARDDAPGSPFPNPYAFTGSGPIWVWDDVNEWLRRRRKAHYLSWRTATPADAEAFCNWLRNRLRPDFALNLHTRRAESAQASAFPASIVMHDLVLTVSHESTGRLASTAEDAWIAKV